MKRALSLSELCEQLTEVMKEHPKIVCDTPKMQSPITRPLTEQEITKLRSAGVTGEYVRVIAFNDRPAPAPTGERTAMIENHTTEIGKNTP